jgi:hypothetical protein
MTKKGKRRIQREWKKTVGMTDPTFYYKLESVFNGEKRRMFINGKQIDFWNESRKYQT